MFRNLTPIIGHGLWLQGQGEGIEVLPPVSVLDRSSYSVRGICGIDADADSDANKKALYSWQISGQLQVN